MKTDIVTNVESYHKHTFNENFTDDSNLLEIFRVWRYMICWRTTERNWRSVRRLRSCQLRMINVIFIHKISCTRTIVPLSPTPTICSFADCDASTQIKRLASLECSFVRLNKTISLSDDQGTRLCDEVARLSDDVSQPSGRPTIYAAQRCTQPQPLHICEWMNLQRTRSVCIGQMHFCRETKLLIR